MAVADLPGNLLVQGLDYLAHLWLKQTVLTQEVVLNPYLLDQCVLKLPIGEKLPMIDTRRRDWKLPVGVLPHAAGADVPVFAI